MYVESQQNLLSKRYPPSSEARGATVSHSPSQALTHADVVLPPLVTRIHLDWIAERPSDTLRKQFFVSAVPLAFKYPPTLSLPRWRDNTGKSPISAHLLIRPQGRHVMETTMQRIACTASWMPPFPCFRRRWHPLHLSFASRGDSLKMVALQQYIVHHPPCHAYQTVCAIPGVKQSSTIGRAGA